MSESVSITIVNVGYRSTSHAGEREGEPSWPRRHAPIEGPGRGDEKEEVDDRVLHDANEGNAQRIEAEKDRGRRCLEERQRLRQPEEQQRAGEGQGPGLGDGHEPLDAIQVGDGDSPRRTRDEQRHREKRGVAGRSQQPGFILEAERAVDRDVGAEHDPLVGHPAQPAELATALHRQGADRQDEQAEEESDRPAIRSGPHQAPRARSRRRKRLAGPRGSPLTRAMIARGPVTMSPASAPSRRRCPPVRDRVRPGHACETSRTRTRGSTKNRKRMFSPRSKSTEPATTMWI